MEEIESGKRISQIYLYRTSTADSELAGSVAVTSTICRWVTPNSAFVSTNTLTPSMMKTSRLVFEWEKAKWQILRALKAWFALAGFDPIDRVVEHGNSAIALSNPVKFRKKLYPSGFPAPLDELLIMNFIKEKEEEIDATDGCRVQVITYRIESADGTEQLTKTIRRKVNPFFPNLSRFVTTIAVMNGVHI
ncbi:hypothetical protein TELCIR_06468 [Teladorsagia circumcincta]|uniref:Uncharacterized protein n=1 Tax=Teladorsagia circumcincta TaxID=45464 RepID=A0A2G9UN23_TELCI|nr:hypothetical protein TELCIR_06468 [Teladorsagia circumcincta]